MITNSEFYDKLNEIRKDFEKQINELKVAFHYPLEKKPIIQQYKVGDCFLYGDEVTMIVKTNDSRYFNMVIISPTNDIGEIIRSNLEKEHLNSDYIKYKHFQYYNEAFEYLHNQSLGHPDTRGID